MHERRSKSDEAARLAGIGTAGPPESPDRCFEELAELTALACGCKVALVSLVDGRRHWYSASQDSPVPGIAIATDVCAHTIVQAEPTVVPDVTLDPRFAGSPSFVGDLCFRFFVGAPIVVNSLTVGTLCAFDVEPRSSDSASIRRLELLARIAASNVAAKMDRDRAVDGLGRMSAFFENTPTIGFLKDPEGRMRYVNRRFEEVFDLSPGYVLGRFDREWLPPELASETERLDAHVRESRGPLSTVGMISAEGRETTEWAVRSFPLLMPDGVWVGGVGLDISELSAARRQARSERDFSDAVLGTVGVLVCVLDRSGCIVKLNEEFERILGWSSSDARGFGLKEILHPTEDRAGTEFRLDQLIETGGTLSYEEAITTRFGEMKVIRWRAGVVLGGSAYEHHFVVSGLDVTDQREAERLLRNEERRFRTALASLHEGVVVHDATGRIVLWNRAAESTLGLTSDQLSGRTSMDPRWRAVREDGSDFPGRDHPAMAALATGVPQPTVTMGIHQPDGTLRWLHVNAVPILGDDGEAPIAAVA